MTAQTPDTPSRAEDFDDFVRFRGQALLRTAYLLTRDQALAEDLLQTALAKAWFVWGRIEGDPSAYTRAILVNTYASWWRRKWTGEQPSGQVPESATVDRQADHDLWAALGRLPKRQRAVVVLRYYEDLSEADTARVLRITPGTVKSQLSKALAKLRLDPGVTSLESPTHGGER